MDRHGGSASLPMYDLPEVRASVEALWRSVAAHLAVDETAFTWPAELEGCWLAPDLVLGQSCGLPLVEVLGRRVGVVGAFTYDGVSDEQARYASVLVAREDRPLGSYVGSRAAINDWGSLSGWASLGAAVAEVAPGEPFFAGVLATGAHVQSITAIRAGDADVAAIDGVTLALLRRHRPGAMEGLVEIGRCPQIPCLPLITASGDVDAVRAAVRAALADERAAADRARLLVSGFVPLTYEDYEPVLALRDAAALTVPRP